MSTQTKAMTKPSKPSHADIPPESPDIPTTKYSDNNLYMALNVIVDIMDIIAHKGAPIDKIPLLSVPPNTPNELLTATVQASHPPNPLDSSKLDITKVHTSNLQYQEVYEM
jgi:hypothetical protein